MSRPSDAPGEAELRRIERVLQRLAPESQQGWTHLLNALLVEAESPPVRGSVLKPLQDALISLVGLGPASRTLDKALQALIQAARLPTDTNPREGPDDKGNTKSYSLGAGAKDLIAHLRFDLGLSALHTSRHMRGFLSVPTPPAALLAMIAGVGRADRI